MSYLSFSEKFPVVRVEKPSNLPLRDLPFEQRLACSIMIPTLLGPPTAFIGTRGIFVLNCWTSFQPGSEIHGIPASLTNATFLLYSKALTISNIFVQLQVLRGISNPLPFFCLVWAICLSICPRSEISIPYSSSSLSPFAQGSKSWQGLSFLTARYFMYSTLNFSCYSTGILLRNFLLYLSVMFEQLQN